MLKWKKVFKDLSKATMLIPETHTVVFAYVQQLDEGIHPFHYRAVDHRTNETIASGVAGSKPSAKTQVEQAISQHYYPGDTE